MERNNQRVIVCLVRIKLICKRLCGVNALGGQLNVERTPARETRGRVLFFYSNYANLHRFAISQSKKSHVLKHKIPDCGFRNPSFIELIKYIKAL